ncbi:hypothetical protein KFL_000890220 [Klebsormidium nitens]|uniref:Methyltransferase FkbM domain-containing protein n=1 Tax=Klebsormidium nitens TaxID=105231 RepID=A0A1Y1HUC9_KLENI|nr:hypothetical protein KFL_000890220 [Klebsormidium nitens]|eukprot:GAQ81733.1 hypothetical protein KFL_000890220 [Klebsormidium nitens]
MFASKSFTKSLGQKMAPRIATSGGGILRQLLLVVLLCALFSTPWLLNWGSNTELFSRQVTISGDWPESITLDQLKEALANATGVLTASLESLADDGNARVVGSLEQLIRKILRSEFERFANASQLGRGALTKPQSANPAGADNSLLGTLRDANTPRLANPVDGTLCGYPKPELAEYLARPHGDGHPNKTDVARTNRYFVSGQWRNVTDAWAEVDGQYYVVGKETVCVVVAANGVMPCLEGECFFQLHARPGTTDMAVVAQILRSKTLNPKPHYQVIDFNEYGFIAPLDLKPKNILDAGGNIGIASLVLGIMWPSARIVTLEPNSENYKVLTKNVPSLPNVTPVHAGLWSKHAQLVIEPNDRRDWGFVVTEPTVATPLELLKDAMTGLSVPSVVDLFGVTEGFDFVKMDIEGSEATVFKPSPDNDLTWIEKADVLLVEFHERFDETGSVELAKKGLIAHPLFKHSVDYEFDVFLNRASNLSFT